MKGKALTVQGAVPPEELGITMAHEHILVDLNCWYSEPAGASQKAHIYEPVSLTNLSWVRRNIFGNKDNLVLDDRVESTREVMDFKRYGGGSIVDVTNVGIGRDPIALKKISLETGIHIIIGAGYYIGAAHPAEMTAKTVEEISEEIVKEVTVGVDGTDVKAGIIGEIGLSDFDKFPNEEKALRAAVLAQKKTGAPLTIHPSVTGDRPLDRLIDILEDEGADFKRTIISHMDVFLDRPMDYSFMAADKGMYIEYDTWGFEGTWPDVGLAAPSDTQRLTGTSRLIENGYLDQVLLSQDVCLKIHTTAYGGTGRAHILRDCIALFKSADITDEEIQAMLVDNPKRILEFV